MRSTLIFLMGLGIVLYAPAAFSNPPCPVAKNPCDYMVCDEKPETEELT